MEGGYIREKRAPRGRRTVKTEPNSEPPASASKRSREATSDSADSDYKSDNADTSETEPESPPHTPPGDDAEQPPENEPAPRPRAKRRKLTKEERAANIKKRFNTMNSNLVEHHPELKDVFEALKLPAKVPTPHDTPEGVNAQLLPFQREGLGWLIEQEKSIYKGGILADEMGLGKTLQTISLIMATHSEQTAPVLVIAPTVAIMQWKNEIERFTGNKLKVLVYHGTNRSQDPKEICSYDVVMTTYAVLESVWRKQQSGFTRKGVKVKEPSVLHQINFHRIVLDEAHNIKDRNSSTTVAVSNLHAKYRLCLSGTPLQNRVGELYSLLRFLKVEPFSQYFCSKCDCKSSEWRVRGQKCLMCGHVAMQHVNYFNHAMLKHIQRLENETEIGIGKMRLLLNKIMLRRTKIERADDLGLPPRTVRVRRDYFNEEEKDLYMSIYGDSQRQFNTYVNQGVVLNNYANIFTLITRMRQIADHPDLVLRKSQGEAVESIVCRICDDEAEDPIKSKCHHTFCRMCVTEYVRGWTGPASELECPVCHGALTIDLEAPAIEVDEAKQTKSSIVNRIRMDESWRSSTKIEALLEELFRLRSNRQTIKSIVFSQFTSMLDLVEWRLNRAGFQTVKLQGNMSPQQRDNIIRHFMETPTVEVFLVSLKAGGVALNLCEASQVFLLDPWWNPSVEWQSGDRVHRIGQTRPVTITRLVIEDSIESRIIELQDKKANMIGATIGSDDAALNRLTQGDMEFLFQN